MVEVEPVPGIPEDKERPAVTFEKLGIVIDFIDEKLPDRKSFITRQGVLVIIVNQLSKLPPTPTRTLIIYLATNNKEIYFSLIGMAKEMIRPTQPPNDKA